jgi:hypothetical protein
LSYFAKLTDTSKHILIFTANTKAEKGVVDTDGTSIPFVGKHGIIFAITMEGNTKSCMTHDSQVVDLFTVKRNTT